MEAGLGGCGVGRGPLRSLDRRASSWPGTKCRGLRPNVRAVARPYAERDVAALSLVGDQSLRSAQAVWVSAILRGHEIREGLSGTARNVRELRPVVPATSGAERR